jgi:WD40 repeat protein
LIRIPGSSHAVAYHGGTLAVGRKNSFVLMDASCLTEPAKSPRACSLAAPAQPFSAVPVDDLAIQGYEHRLLLASTGYEATGNEAGVLNLWDITGAAKTGEIIHLGEPIRFGSQAGQLAFDPKWPLVAVAAQDGKARVWNVTHPRKPSRLHIKHSHGNENQPVEAVAFSPNGSLLASGGLDQQVVLWKVRRQGDRFRVKRTLRTLIQSQSILSVAFSADGTTLAAGDGDGSTCIYDLASRRPIGGSFCLPGHRTAFEGGGIRSLAFTPKADGEPRLLATGTGQPILAWDSILWDQSTDAADEQRLTAAACAIAGRNLNSPEWTEIFGTTQLADDSGQTCVRYPPHQSGR